MFFCHNYWWKQKLLNWLQVLKTLEIKCAQNSSERKNVCDKCVLGLNLASIFVLAFSVSQKGQNHCTLLYKSSLTDWQRTGSYLESVGEGKSSKAARPTRRQRPEGWRLEDAEGGGSGTLASAAATWRLGAVIQGILFYCNHVRNSWINLDNAAGFFVVWSRRQEVGANWCRIVKLSI